MPIGRLLPSLEAEKQRADLRSFEQALIRPDRASNLSVDYVCTDEAWDENRRLWQVRRRAVRLSLPLQQSPAKAAASLPLRLTWAATALAFCTSAILLVGTVTGPGQQPPDSGASVEIELGPPAAARPRPIVPELEEPAPSPAAQVAPAPTVATPVASPSDAAEPVPVQSAEPEPAAPVPLRLDAMESVRQAFSRAVETGAAEPWSENGLSGYVVVGPSMLSDERVCRNLAIWLDRAGGSGEVMDGQRCLAEDGRWVDS